MAKGYTVEMPKPSSAATPWPHRRCRWTLIYEPPGPLSTQHLHFFDSGMTFLALAPVDNLGREPAKLLIESANRIKLLGRQNVKRIFPAPGPPGAPVCPPGLWESRMRVIYPLAPLQPH